MKGKQSGKFTLVLNEAVSNLSESAFRTTGLSIERIDIKTGTVQGQGTLLMTIINNYFFWFNAVPVAANIVQTGTTGAWTINIPTVVTANKSFFIPDKNTIITYLGTKYGFQLTPEVFPVYIRLLVAGEPTGQIMCKICSDGTIDWPDTAVRTPTAIGTTGLTQYFIN